MRPRSSKSINYMKYLIFREIFPFFSFALCPNLSFRFERILKVYIRIILVSFIIGNIAAKQ